MGIHQKWPDINPLACSQIFRSVDTASEKTMTFTTLWKTEHADMLRNCLDSGMSHGRAAETINRKFGTYYSRNAAIGKAFRHGWKSTEARGKRPVVSFPLHGDVTRFGPRPEPRPKPILRPGPPSASIPKLPHEEVVMRCAAIEPLNLSLLEVEGCRWPYGGWPSEAPITFCGHKQINGSSYCVEHSRLASGPGSYGERRAHRRVYA